ncbi:MAG: hypothetical protein IJV24_03255 [Prevotella sp.]|nr:hypothetical protein [Prevotella sp.]
MATTKLERLNFLNSTLLLCEQDCVKDAEEWQVYDDMMARVKNMMTEEQHRLGYMAVYPIVDGQATTAIFNGTPDECDTYVSILLEGHPEMKGNIIITNI